MLTEYFKVRKATIRIVIGKMAREKLVEIPRIVSRGGSLISS